MWRYVRPNLVKADVVVLEPETFAEPEPSSLSHHFVDHDGSDDGGSGGIQTAQPAVHDNPISFILFSVKLDCEFRFDASWYGYARNAHQRHIQPPYFSSNTTVLALLFTPLHNIVVLCAPASLLSSSPRLSCTSLITSDYFANGRTLQLYLPGPV